LIAGVDTKLAARENRAAERQDKAVARRQRINELCKAKNETVVLESSTSSSDNDSDQMEAAPQGTEEKAHQQIQKLHLATKEVEILFPAANCSCLGSNEGFKP